jgi:hypothetical protein
MTPRPCALVRRKFGCLLQWSRHWAAWKPMSGASLEVEAAATVMASG